MNPFVTDYSVQWANKIFGMTDINNQMLLSQPFDNKTDPYLIQSNYFYRIKSSSYLLTLNYAKLNDTEKRKCGIQLVIHIAIQIGIQSVIQI